MTRFIPLRSFICGLALAFPAAFSGGTAAYAQAAVLPSSAGDLLIEPMYRGLSEPWALGFLPDGGVLITERGGRLLHLREGGDALSVAGVPEVVARGQGGLLDLMVPRDFAQSRRVFLVYAAAVRGGSATALGRGQLSAEGDRLTGFEQIWVADGLSGSKHFGARLVEAPDGSLYLGLGDRGTGPDGLEAQDRSLTHGKVMHLSRDGAPLPAAFDWRPGIRSLGHRNIQGAALDASGQLWVTEHGARGGDEVNRADPGKNYGWPVISYGVNYIGTSIGIGQAAPGLEQPAHYWDPSMAPSGLAILRQSRFSGWQGSFLVGSLKFDYIARLDPAKGFAEEPLKAPETARVRDIREAPDGSVWFLSVDHGAVYRMIPAAAR